MCCMSLATSQSQFPHFTSTSFPLNSSSAADRLVSNVSPDCKLLTAKAIHCAKYLVVSLATHAFLFLSVTLVSPLTVKLHTTRLQCNSLISPDNLPSLRSAITCQAPKQLFMDFNDASTSLADVFWWPDSARCLARRSGRRTSHTVYIPLGCSESRPCTTLTSSPPDASDYICKNDERK